MPKQDHRTRVAGERRDRMRRRLFESALQVVARKGPAATSIDDVIQAAEVSRGTFYKYFDAPDTLFDALALEVANEIIRMAEPAVLHGEDAAQRVATGMRLTIHLARSNPEVGGFLVRLGWPEMRNGAVILDPLQRDIRQGMRQGRFMAMPMRLAVNIVSMTVLGTVHAMLEMRAPGAFAEQAVESALRALGMEPKEAVRLATLELPPPQPVEGGLLGADSAARALRPRRKAAATP
jgi:TetR/AcrR family transcriptional regulator, ethionamide resistance regulator